MDALSQWFSSLLQGLASLPQGLASLPQGLANLSSLPQGLASLPDELILIIFDYIEKITDKRQFLRTCMHYNKITKQSFVNFENRMAVIYFRKIRDVHGDILRSINYEVKFNEFKDAYVTKLCPEKFIIELSHDGYPELISVYSNSISKLCLNRDKKVKLMEIFAIYNNVKLLEKYSVSNEKISQWNRCGNIPDTEYICWNGATHGHISVLEFCKNKGYNINFYVCENAAAAGHIHILEWYIKNGYEWSENSSTHAAYYGHLNVIKWIIESGFNLDPETLNRAAHAGNLDIIKWLIQNKFPFDLMECLKNTSLGCWKINLIAGTYTTGSESRDYINKISQKYEEVRIWVINGCLI